MRKTLLALGATALMAGTTLVAAQPAGAADATRVLAVGYHDADFGGASETVDAYDQGDCNAEGYLVVIDISGEGKGLSSIGASSTSPGCNYAEMYSYYRSSTDNIVCGSGYLPMAFVGDACNDKIQAVRYKHV